MINFKWLLILCGIICTQCIIRTCEANTEEPLKLKTQVIKAANPFTRASIFRNPYNYYDFLANSKFFVDTSLLIEYVFDAPITLITLARGFGKSMNLNMLRTFFEIEFDPTTKKIVPEDQTKAYYLFKCDIVQAEIENITLRPRFLIKERKRIMEQMNKYPVVHLNLGNPHGRYRDLKEICKFIVSKTNQTFDAHRYMQSFNNTPPGLKYGKALEHLNLINCSVRPGEVSVPLVQLISALREHFDVPVIVLIDEYDSMLNGVLIESIRTTENYPDEVIQYFGNYFGALLKNNENVKTAVLTGIIPWKNSGVFSELFDKISIKTIADDTPSEFFGITQENLRDMFNLSHDGVFKENAFHKMESFYDGYLFGKAPFVKKFNPVSVAMFFNKNQAIKEYWTKTGNVKVLLEKLNKFKNFNTSFSKLLSGGEVKITSSPSAIDFSSAAKLVAKADSLNENEWYKSDLSANDIDLAFSSLYYAGYLTLSNRAPSAEVWMRIPNKEVMEHLSQSANQ